jgi:hypothetical protein
MPPVRGEKLRPTRDERASAVVDAIEKKFRDPLANMREREKRRAGFDYRPELADPKELI